MFSVIFFAILFVVVYFIYYFIFDDKLKKEKYTKISELVILTKKFNLDKKKMDYKSLLNGVALINAFIVATTATVVDIIPVHVGIKLLIAIVLIVCLITGIYYCYGKILSKKWGKQNGI